jgi:hypothetical protein
MIRTAFALFVVSGLWISSSFAQAAVGGPKKSQNYIGGVTARTNPVVPPQRGEMTNTVPSVPKPPKR